MSKGILNFNESAVEYYTPKYLVDMFGEFDYDPATTAEQADRFLTTKRFHDSLNKRELNVHIVLPNERIKFIGRDGQIEKSPAFGSVVVTPIIDIEGKILRIKEGG